MLTSLFGDLGIGPQAGERSRPTGTIVSDGGFAATAVLEASAAEVNDRGQIVDRQVRDLFVTGSPAQAMREHFASSRAELENAGKWIVLIDPARIWAGAVVKALSDAGGQPIERLHLREQGTLRTLATIERTAIVRRLDDTLKVYHAEVRASGRENAEISQALMERSHMTAVVVGPLQPLAIDSLLGSLHRATLEPTWCCPALLFLLPPSAVWIGNKIAGIAWPRGLRVQILNEPMSGASAVWNAVLGMWNQVKDSRPLDGPGQSPAAEADEFPIRISELALGGNGAAAEPVRLFPVATSPPLSTRAGLPIDSQRAAQALSEVLRADGLLACAIVDAGTGFVLAHEQRDTLQLDLDIAAAAASQVLRSQRLAARSMGLHDHIEELMVSAASRQQVLRVLSRHPELFLFALLDKQRTNLALVRFRLLEAEKNLV